MATPRSNQRTGAELGFILRAHPCYRKLCFRETLSSQVQVQEGVHVDRYLHDRGGFELFHRESECWCAEQSDRFDLGDSSLSKRVQAIGDGRFRGVGFSC